MEARTDRANMKDWLDASPDIKLRTYIESCISTLSVREGSFADQNLYEALREVSLPLFNQEFQLHQELQAWDELSDEALMIFERELI